MDIVVISYDGMFVDGCLKALGRYSNDEDMNIIVQQSENSIPYNVNRGAEQVESDWFVLFNDDWEPMADCWLDRLVMLQDDDIGVISPLFVFDDGTVNNDGGYIISPNGLVRNIGMNKQVGAACREDKYVDYAHGVMVRTELFRRIGGYDESFKGSQFADIDFAYRVMQTGYRAFYAGSVSILHHHDKNPRTRSVRNLVRVDNEMTWQRKHGFKGGDSRLARLKARGPKKGVR